MAQKFPIAASLAFGGFTFFVGSLLTLQFASFGQQQPSVQDTNSFTSEQSVVSRASTQTLVPAAQAATPSQPVIAQPAAARPAPSQPAASSATANLLTALQASVAPPGADPATSAVSSPVAAGIPPKTPGSLGDNLAIMQLAAKEFRKKSTSNLSDAIRQNALDEVTSGRDQTEIQELLSNAARNGLIQVPEGLTAADGSVDARSLLFSLVEKAVADKDASPSRGTALPAQTASIAPRLGSDAVYTVEAGDSLAFIALQFYGNTAEYTRIYNANRDILNSPDRIRVGQRLKIPAG